ncbi:MAG TPA: NADH-quinone oxidoreductase subunit A [Candidatus Bathyarchaeia archaeon]
MTLDTLVESAIAFVVIVAMTLLVYAVGRRASPRPVQSENERSTYACGEEAPLQKQRISVTLSKYLIYFVILDSSVLLLAFAALVTHIANMPLLILYLLMLLASSLLLVEGGRDQ